MYDRHCTLQINLGSAAHVVTKALDYVGIDDLSHGRRVGLMCHRIAHALGWDQDRRHFMLLAGMLHDIGVSSTDQHQKLVDELEWVGAQQHCQRGQEFLHSFEPFVPYAETIAYHHTRWTEMPEALRFEAAEQGNLIFLADRVDVFYARFLAQNPAYQILTERQQILDQVLDVAPLLFAPHLVDAFAKAIERDRFWLELQDEFLDDAITETLQNSDHNLVLDCDALECMAELISRIVDTKSPFTHAHSLRVADLTYTLAGHMGYELTRRRMLRIAGLLHDVGKLRTPDSILEKNGKLDNEEYAQMKVHPMNSKRVLQALFPDTPMIDWVAQHHEKLNGKGYPFGWRGEEICEESRLLAICDIFQALSQKRPYRDVLPLANVLAIMERMVGEGELDGDIFAVLCANGAELYNISLIGLDPKILERTCREPAHSL